MTNYLLPPPRERRNNPDDAIGEEIRISDACVRPTRTAAEKVQYLLPDNGEYVYSHNEGSCAVCGNCSPRRMARNDGTCDGKGHCARRGAFPYYKRTRYGADSRTCCLQNPASHVIGGMTCPPDTWGGPTSEACSSVFQSVCERPRDMDRPVCQQWAQHFPDAAFTAMANYCRYDPAKEACEVWAETSGEAEARYRAILKERCTADLLKSSRHHRELCRKYRGACNAAAREYCSQPDADEYFCSCINSRVQQGIPECIDNKCYMYGYKTIADPPVCKQTLCSVYWDIAEAGGDIELRDNTVVQRCGTRPDDYDPDEGEWDEGGWDDDGGEGEGDGKVDVGEWARKNQVVVGTVVIAAALIFVLLLLRGRR